jgi:hypothetical protein
MIFAKSLNKKNLDYLYKSIFVLICAYRIYLCFQVPYGSDPLWHLGFASHAFDGRFSIYQLTSTDFQPESWTNAIAIATISNFWINLKLSWRVTELK